MLMMSPRPTFLFWHLYYPFNFQLLHSRSLAQKLRQESAPSARHSFKSGPESLINFNFVCHFLWCILFPEEYGRRNIIKSNCHVVLEYTDITNHIIVLPSLRRGGLYNSEIILGSELHIGITLMAPLLHFYRQTRRNSSKRFRNA